MTEHAPSWLISPANGFLSDAEERLLDAIFARLLPADPLRGVPGAVQARASRFVSLLLARDTSVYVEIPAWQQLYPATLSALDAWARVKHSKGLAELNDTQVNELIAGLEAASLPNLPGVDQLLVFKTFLRHCIQGCFADPRWGGNHDRIMWRWIGYLQAAEDFR